MDTYNEAAGQASRAVTETFSSSFSSAITLFDDSIRQDIYNLYGLARVADEIVDTHQEVGTEELLNDFEREVYSALNRGFSTNLIVHAFCHTASKHAIERELIAPFFASMRMDVTLKVFTKEQYDTYIYGSAEVVGLMCLKVFAGSDRQLYERLKKGSAALGAAYQKVNFLRDIRDDYVARGRFYFPDMTYDTFDEANKATIVADIRHDFRMAEEALGGLPKSARFATRLSYDYYVSLLNKLDRMSVAELKNSRASVSKQTKLRYLWRARIGKYAD